MSNNVNLNFKVELDENDLQSQINAGIQNSINNVVKENVEKIFKTEKDMDRIISNNAYYIVWEMVNKAFNQQLEELLTDKIKSIIENLSEYSVLHDDPYGHLSYGTKIINNVLSDSDLLKNRVNEIINSEHFTKTIQKKIVQQMIDEMKESLLKR